MTCKILFSLIAILCISYTSKIQEGTNVEEPLTDTIAYANNFLKGTTWHINEQICLNENLEEYFVEKFSEPKESDRWIYGSYLAFEDSVNFRSYYTAPCGNDCFETVCGKYRLMSETEVRFAVDSITADGDCWQPTRYPKGKETRFAIVPIDSIDGYVFNKIK